MKTTLYTRVLIHIFNYFFLQLIFFFLVFYEPFTTSNFIYHFSKSLLQAVDLSILKYARHTYIHRLYMTSFDQTVKDNITFTSIIEFLCPCFVSSSKFLSYLIPRDIFKRILPLQKHVHEYVSIFHNRHKIAFPH